ncbi:MAG: hypothetical protein ACFE95_21680 [Candidatus Hodarchaeota archaeon]
MALKEFFSNEPKTSQEIRVLKNHLKLSKNPSKHDLMANWRSIHHMRAQLDIPTHVSFNEVVTLFFHFEEIRELFDLKTNNFHSLNTLYVEIATVKDMLNLPKEAPLTETVASVKPEILPSLGVGINSLLEKVLTLYHLK